MKIEIALLVDENGKWYALGWDGENIREVFEIAWGGFESDGLVSACIVTAEVDLPKPKMVSGEITDAIRLISGKVRKGELLLQRAVKLLDEGKFDGTAAQEVLNFLKSIKERD